MCYSHMLCQCAPLASVIQNKKENPTMRIDLPQNVNFIIDRLYEHGFEAYAVGGCVRDSLLGRTPQDWDITTSASPQQVMISLNGLSFFIVPFLINGSSSIIR